MIFDLLLIGLTIIAVLFAIHYRARAKTLEVRASYTGNTGIELENLKGAVTSDLESMKGTVRAIIDNKFDSLAKWISAELAKHHVDIKNATAPTVAVPVTLPEGPLAPIADDDAAKMLAQMESAISQLTDKKAKLADALKVKQQADSAVRQVLGE